MVIYDSCLVIALSYREEILLSIHFEPITSKFNDKAFVIQGTRERAGRRKELVEYSINFRSSTE